MSALLLIIILIVLIVVHEFGHFLAARLLGVTVEEFGVGYPPRAFTFGVRGGTEYTLNWMPFGGFVRLRDENGTEEDAGRRIGSFAQASRWRQALILIAGVVANAFFGWVLYTGGFMTGMPVEVSDATEGARLIVSEILPGSPAYRSGLAPGDEIKSMTDARGPAELTPQSVVAFVRERAGQELSIVYVRDGTETQTTAIPVHAVLANAPGDPALGAGLLLIAEKRLPFFAAAKESFSHTWYAFSIVVSRLGSLVKDAVFGNANITALVGPVGLASAVGDAAAHGLGQLFALAALVSINLAVINLIPIPALDGGRLFFVGIEAVMRKKIPMRIAHVANAVGFTLILVLMVLVTYGDIIRLAA
ncbi:MAG: M50 family metallopeptidase [Patescibacteria group bacterium]